MYCDMVNCKSSQTSRKVMHDSRGDSARDVLHTHTHTRTRVRTHARTHAHARAHTHNYARTVPPNTPFLRATPFQLFLRAAKARTR